MKVKEKFNMLKKINIIISISILVFSIILFGCAANISKTENIFEEKTQNENITENPVDNTTDTITKTEQTKTYTLLDISSHSTKDSCFMSIDGKVYDVTDFVSNHPGGKAILFGCGKEASAMFAGKHSDKARALLPNYYIGDLAN